MRKSFKLGTETPASRTPSEDERRWEDETLIPSLKKSPERKESFTTLSGVPINRLYTSADLAGLDYERELGDPGSYPYTRGIHETMYRGRLWTLRQFSGFGTPESHLHPHGRGRLHLM